MKQVKQSQVVMCIKHNDNSKEIVSAQEGRLLINKGWKQEGRYLTPPN